MLIKHMLEVQDTIRTSSTILVLNDGNEGKWFFNKKYFKWKLFSKKICNRISYIA